MTETYSSRVHDDERGLDQLTTDEWPDPIRHSLRRSQQRDQNAIENLQAEQEALKQLPWRQRLLHLGRRAAIANEIAILQGKIRARDTMYGELSTDFED